MCVWPTATVALCLLTSFGWRWKAATLTENLGWCITELSKHWNPYLIGLLQCLAPLASAWVRHVLHRPGCLPSIQSANMLLVATRWHLPRLRRQVTFASAESRRYNILCPLTTLAAAVHRECISGIFHPRYLFGLDNFPYSQPYRSHHVTDVERPRRLRF